MTTGPTKRSHPRVPVALPVSITDVAGRSHGHISFDTRDLSIGGAFLSSGLLLELDEVVRLEFTIGQRTVHAQAKVARVSRDAPTGMGVTFVAMSEEDKAAIREFLARAAA